MRRLLLTIGLVILVFLLYYCTKGHAPEIQADILDSTNASLVAEDIDWVNVTADGRTIILKGVAPNEIEKNRISSIVSKVEGVIAVVNQVTISGSRDVAALPDFLTRFTYADGQLVLSGVVPDEAVKNEILAEAKSIFRSAALDNQLVVSSVSMLAGWKETAMVGLTQLGEFSKGNVTFKEDVIHVRGIVDSPTTIESVRKAIDGSLDGQFTASYDINLEQFSSPEPAPEVVAMEAPKKAVSQKAEIMGCQSRFDQALAGQHIRFTTSRAAINSESNALLTNLATIAKSCPNTHIEVEGHTDSQGSDKYNMKLSKERAEAVLQYLISKDVRADRLAAVGYGELQPVADNSTAVGRSKNRRIEFTVKAK